MKRCFSYLGTGITVLLICTTFVSPNKGAPINQTTKTCLITGASSGIGYNLALEMIKHGWTVIAIARGEEKLKNIADKIGQQFIPYVCDVSKPEQVRQISEQIKKEQLKPTLFFLNAGLGYREEKFKPILDKQKQLFDTNYFGVLSWVDAWINEVKTYGGGTFVVTSSINALFPGQGFSGYSTSKSAIVFCFRSLRLTYRNDNIGFVTVLPGPVYTGNQKGDWLKQPFIHKPDNEARYIVEQIFKRKQQIEPSWYYSLKGRYYNLVQ